MNKCFNLFFIVSLIFGNCYSGPITIVRNIGSFAKGFFRKEATRQKEKISDLIKSSTLGDKTHLVSGSSLTLMGLVSLGLGEFISGTILTGAGVSTLSLAIKNMRLRQSSKEINDKLNAIGQLTYYNGQINAQNASSLKRVETDIDVIKTGIMIINKRERKRRRDASDKIDKVLKTLQKHGTILDQHSSKLEDIQNRIPRL